ncbi:hypothetical protein HDU83_005520 [Entophlyctis luteolus]|nr:hypothetical protein HDU83_005520 [Entophlyctis luteolus]
MRRTSTAAAQSASPTLSSVSSYDDDEDLFIPSSSSHASQPAAPHARRKRKAPSSPREQELDNATRMQRERQRAATQACRERKARHLRELEAYVGRMDANGGCSDETRELRIRVQELERENAALAAKMTATAATAATATSSCVYHSSAASDSPATGSDLSTDVAALGFPDLLAADPFAFPTSCGSEMCLVDGDSGLNWSLSAQPLLGGEQWFI